MTESGTRAETVLEAEGLHKSYGGTRALRGAPLCLRAGEVHALVGENGSGKSTLLKILAGQIARDRGRILLNGGEVRFTDAAQAIGAGIATVTQETTLVPDLSVTENIFLGHRKARKWFGIDWRRTRAHARDVLARLELTSIDPDDVVRRLRPDEQQLVEIARAISIDARVVILDEPTSSLSDDEVESLFSVIRTLKGQGVAICFVSHRINEVFAIADVVTILRDGQLVGSGPISDYDRERMIHLMTGRELEELKLDRGRHRVRDPALRVRELRVPGRIDDVQLEVGRGEIVGLAGLVGAGRGELLAALFGAHGAVGGRVEVDGVPVRHRHPLGAIRNGIAYVPAERKRLGLVADMTIRENILMARTAGLLRVMRPKRASEQRAVQESVDAFRILTPSQIAPVWGLSGGNQQKVVLAKWLGTGPKVLLMDEPTRGVDVGAKADIYKLLNRAKEEGVAILISSSETPELLLLCDRILVMFRGRITAALSRDEATEGLIAGYAMGHE